MKQETFWLVLNACVVIFGAVLLWAGPLSFANRLIWVCLFGMNCASLPDRIKEFRRR